MRLEQPSQLTDKVRLLTGAEVSNFEMLYPPIACLFVDMLLDDAHRFFNSWRLHFNFGSRWEFSLYRHCWISGLFSCHCGAAHLKWHVILLYKCAFAVFHSPTRFAFLHGYSGLVYGGIGPAGF